MIDIITTIAIRLWHFARVRGPERSCPGNDKRKDLTPASQRGLVAWRVALYLAWVVWFLSAPASAATLFSDDFEDGTLAQWSVILGDANDAGVNDDTSQSGSESLFVRFDQVAVASPVIDTSGGDATLQLWLRRGDDGFSNHPESGEDLQLYYLNDNNNYTLLDTFQGGGTPGEIFTPSYSLPADARHPGFRVAALLTQSNGFDYWHIDDVTVTQTASPFIGNGTGLSGAYCDRDGNNETVPCDSNPDANRIDPTIDFSNGDADWPGQGIGGDTYSVRWIGEIQAQYTEDYRLHTISDDGIRVYIDGNLVINNYTDHGPTENISSPISLTRGDKYDIEIEYYENGGGQVARLLWSSPSTAPQGNPVVVPKTQLYPEPNVNADLLAEYRFDESSWDGTQDEVVENSGNANSGTARNGADTAGSNRAIAGDPGTCRYGTFDGTDDYVNVDNLSTNLDQTASLSFWIRTTQTGNDKDFDAPGVTGVEQTGGTNDIFWGWIDANGHIGISVGDDQENEQKSTTSINDGTWHHVVLTRDSSSGETQVFVDGDLENTGTTGTGTIGTAFSSIGRIDATDGDHKYFAGQLDELRVYDEVLNEAEAQSVFGSTHPCSGGANQSCAGDFAVYADNELKIDDRVKVNGNAVSGSGNAIDPDTGNRTDANIALPPLQPSSFPGFSSSRKVEAPGDGSTFMAGDYEEIKIKKDASATLDTSNGDDFRIEKKLKLEDRSSVSLQPGRYFIDTLELGKDVTLSVAGSGSVEISIGSELKVDDRSSVNAGGDVDDLQVRIYDDAKAEADLGKMTVFVGTIYAPGSNSRIKADDRADITGGIFSGGEIELKKDVMLTYGQDATSAGREVSGCAPAGPDHYAVLDPGQGLTCEALPVTIQARDDDDNPVDPPAGTRIDVTANGADASWAGSGNAQTSATFGDNADSAILQLRRTSPGNVNVDVTDGNATEIASADPDIPFAEAGFLFYANGSPNAIGTQIAAKPSNAAPGAQNLELRAVEDPNGPMPGAACEARLSDDQTIEMAFACNDPSSCAGRQVAIGGSDIPGNDDGAVSSYGNVTLDFGGNGRAPLVLNYPDAGAISLYARANLPSDGNEPATTLTGQSNQFVVRPFGFRVTADGNPGATSASGGTYVDAGEDFTVDVTAVGWSSGDDTNADGVPDDYGNNNPTDNPDLSDNVTLPNFGSESSDEAVRVDSRLWRPSGGNDPGLSGSTTIDEADFEDSSDVALGAADTTVQFDEVGIIELQTALADGDYLGTGFDVPGRSGAVGRFIPADFDQAVTDGGFRNVCNATFTYLGQPFGYAPGMVPEFLLTARNVGGATTENYTGDFAKLVVGDIERTLPAEDNSHTGRGGDPLGLDGARSSLDTGTLTDNGDGTLTYTFAGSDAFTYARDGDARVAPFDADLTITTDAIEDADGVAVPPAGLVDTTPDPNEQRFGRLIVEDAYGPETAPVTQEWRIEYWEGDTWKVNEADGCTRLPLADAVELDPDSTDGNGNDKPGDSKDVALSSGNGTTDIASELDVTGGEIVFDDGTANLRFTAPGSENRGWVEVRALLATDYPHLLADTDGDGTFDDAPAARVTFGVYAGEPSQIYQREVFPAP